MSATSRNSLMRAKLAQHMLKNAQGFTLIELLVVIVIVGILSAVAIPTFLNQIRRARTAEAQTALSDVSRNSETFRLDYGIYPPTKKGRTFRVNPADRAAKAPTFECDTSLQCLEGGDTASKQYLKVYMTDPFQEKAPNFSDAAGVSPNTFVNAELSDDEASGILWSALANTAVAGAYKTVANDPLDCRLGLGTAANIGIAAGGPNIEGGCNLKEAKALPKLGSIKIADR